MGKMKELGSSLCPASDLLCDSERLVHFSEPQLSCLQNGPVIPVLMRPSGVVVRDSECGEGHRQTDGPGSA